MSTAARKKKAGKNKPAAPLCPKCGRKQAIKSGKVGGEQRWKCKSCAYQYTRVEPRGRPLWQKSLVVFLYSYGMSMHAIGRIFHVRPSTVLKWVKSYTKDHRPSPEKGDILITDLKDIRRRLNQQLKGNEDAGMLLIALDNAAFRKGLGITITER
ncbi:MAG: IS1 family transposase [Pseudomonadota bacterium]|nr:IS1 family transposase [Pseudomonadota bacterium]